MSKWPPRTRLIATRTSQALATNAPRLGRTTRMVTPTANSITPTIAINVVVENGRSCCATGATYASQFVSRLKNLSSPANVAIRPIAIRSVETVPLSRVSIVSCLHQNRVGRRRKVTAVHCLHANGAGVVYGKQSQTVRTSHPSDADRVSARLAGDGVDLRHHSSRDRPGLLVRNRLLDDCCRFDQRAACCAVRSD